MLTHVNLPCKYNLEVSYEVQPELGEARPTQRSEPIAWMNRFPARLAPMTDSVTTAG